MTNSTDWTCEELAQLKKLKLCFKISFERKEIFSKFLCTQVGHQVHYMSAPRDKVKVIVKIKYLVLFNLYLNELRGSGKFLCTLVGHFIVHMSAHREFSRTQSSGQYFTKTSIT